MTIHLTHHQAETTLKALETRLANAEGILRRLERLGKFSAKYLPTKEEIKSLRLVMAEIKEQLMLKDAIFEETCF